MCEQQMLSSKIIHQVQTPPEWKAKIVSYCLVRNDYSTVEAEIAQESKTGFFNIFRLDHIVEVVLHEVEHIESASLYLELVEAHRHVLIPDIVGSDMRTQRLDIEKTSVLALTFKYCFCFGVFGSKLL